MQSIHLSFERVSKKLLVAFYPFSLDYTYIKSLLLFATCSKFFLSSISQDHYQHTGSGGHSVPAGKLGSLMWAVGGWFPWPLQLTLMPAHQVSPASCWWLPESLSLGWKDLSYPKVKKSFTIRQAAFLNFLWFLVGKESTSESKSQKNWQTQKNKLLKPRWEAAFNYSRVF